ncbi:2',3'-cyclic-nucleotide 3'-phosphodiesterase [Schizosaccharomyces octosporus yFS286]|uniref:2',3'-cyclic-nucleotide 3'-phosphodiesterase n=1 Tax=Schizosaccharomyces octosporus (strain yFS286) TaxID=483514 RepID=S9RBL2_SCHOY|nr:2',3'-cyclic-nucleotide 3'-phosphodiesterase [Schizosaccharomyces octosporus yFS286]EPX71514.1 2',3'-cyclic-nucleotide 3'-phosphodiesterase [Schizosaccharomyces octosporus yFS286]
MHSTKHFPSGLEDRSNNPGAYDASDEYAYCIWIVPAYSSEVEIRYRKFTKWALSHEEDFQNMRLPTAPHVTLAKGIHLKEGQSFESVLKHIASKKISPMDIKFGKVALGNTYFDRVHYQILRTPALNELQQAAYELVDENFSDETREPYMPLIYAEAVEGYWGTSDPLLSLSSISNVNWENPSFLELVQVNLNTHQGIICGRVEVS